MKKKISIGISDFKELIEKNNYFIDKSLLIKEFVENGAKIILTPRPRRFGKTLNLSMLKYFFDIQLKEQTKDLFKELKIEKELEIMNMQGNYPVIFISFKNQKQFSIDDLYISIKNLIKTLFDEHNYLLKSSKLSEKEKEDMQRFINGDIQRSEVSEGLGILTKILSKHYDKKVMIFIDEYDIPIQESYVRGYYEEGIAFMRNILSSALKDNEYLEKAMITGVLYRGNETPTPDVVGVSDSHKRQAFGSLLKESIFSGLNNLEVDTILGYNFNDKFGFEQDEVDTLLKYYNLQEKLDEVGEWYNGYLFGGNVIYNPWSVLNYLKNNKIGFIPYWINTSDNILIKKLLSKGNKETKQSLENLIEGKTITKIINDHIVMKDVEEEPENIWSFLTMCGYLKVVHQELIHGRMHCELKIPNKEVKIFYEDLIEKWFSESLSTESYNDMLKALTTKDIETFEEIFTDFVLRSMSYFDIDGKAPEKVYHAFVLASAPAGESENNEFFLVIATGFTAISDKLFDKGILPSIRKFEKYFL